MRLFKSHPKDILRYTKKHMSYAKALSHTEKKFFGINLEDRFSSISQLIAARALCDTDWEGQVSTTSREIASIKFLAGRIKAQRRRERTERAYEVYEICRESFTQDPKDFGWFVVQPVNLPFQFALGFYFKEEDEYIIRSEYEDHALGAHVSYYKSDSSFTEQFAMED